MPFSLRELNWMLDAKSEMNREILECILTGIFQAMANQMALLKAIHTGRRISPEEFYKPAKRAYQNPFEDINDDGFEQLKSLFVK